MQRLVRLEMVDHLPSAEPGQAEVQHDAVESLFLQSGQGLLACRDRCDLGLNRLHEVDDVLLLDRVVLDDENHFF